MITIAYRLGPLGFLALPGLTAESRHHSSGNYGLMDQIAALAWVQRNIAAFGGDPKRVTIAGQSAGSMAVSALMAAPQARGLFQRAIGESGGPFEPIELASGYRLANAEHDGERYVAALGVKSLEAVRRLPVASLLNEAALAVSHPTHPVAEPDVLAVLPYEAYASGEFNDVPLLIGSNAEEARALVDVSAVKSATFQADIEHSFGSLPPAMLEAYPHATDSEARGARLGFERDLRFGWDMWAWARLHASRAHSPVYYYSLRQRPPFPAGSVYAGWGASHYAELWYAFDHLNQAPWSWSPGERRLAAAMSRAWVQFAKSGNPNGPGLPRWPVFMGVRWSISVIQSLSDRCRTGRR